MQTDLQSGVQSGVQTGDSWDLCVRPGLPTCAALFFALYGFLYSAGD